MKRDSYVLLCIHNATYVVYIHDITSSYNATSQCDKLSIRWGLPAWRYWANWADTIGGDLEVCLVTFSNDIFFYILLPNISNRTLWDRSFKVWWKSQSQCWSECLLHPFARQNSFHEHLGSKKMQMSLHCTSWPSLAHSVWTLGGVSRECWGW